MANRSNLIRSKVTIGARYWRVNLFRRILQSDQSVFQSTISSTELARHHPSSSRPTLTYHVRAAFVFNKHSWQVEPLVRTAGWPVFARFPKVGACSALAVLRLFAISRVLRSRGYGYEILFGPVSSHGAAGDCAGRMRTWCDQSVGLPGPSDKVAGFWLGLWHGFIAPFVFLVSLFKNGLGIYEVHNNGGWYNFGYLFGLACIFGGGRHGSRRKKTPAQP